MILIIMLPIITIVGRPNVGKSTLFNTLTHTSNAIAYNSPGTTRDSQYCHATFNKKYPYILVDTQGIINIDNNYSYNVSSMIPIKESDIILFLVDAKDGITEEDYFISKFLLQLKHDIILLVNKTDISISEIRKSEFYNLGIKDIFYISASHGRGIDPVFKKSLLPLYNQDIFNKSLLNINKCDTTNISFSLIGQPNVGKSTLTNKILNKNRVIVSEKPGTTRDSIYINFIRNNKHYTIIDTAGMRSKKKIFEYLEKVAMIKTLNAIKLSTVVVFIINAKVGLTDQDIKLIKLIIKYSKPMVMIINKCDTININDIKKTINKDLFFIKHYIKFHFISALYENNFDKVFSSIEHAYRNTTQNISSYKLNKIIQLAIKSHNPPQCNKKFSIKIKYAHLGGKNPPKIIFHGNRVTKLPNSYKTYLENNIRKHFNFYGTIIKLEFKDSKNPYKRK